MSDEKMTKEEELSHYSVSEFREKVAIAAMASLIINHDTSPSDQQLSFDEVQRISVRAWQYAGQMVKGRSEIESMIREARKKAASQKPASQKPPSEESEESGEDSEESEDSEE